MIVGFGGSNSTVFPSLFASGQRGTITLPMIELKRGGSPNLLPGATPPEKPKARYGDYFGSAIDPTDSAIRWIAGEYMQAPPPAIPPTPPPKPPRWSTAISRVTLASSLPGSTAPGSLAALNASELCYWRGVQ